MTDSRPEQDLGGDYEFDPAHTRLGFIARHAMVTKVRGSFQDFDGKLHIDADDPENSTAEVRIVANSIDTGVQQRDGHLRSNDFFDMATFPEIRFASTGIETVDSATYRVTGDLTIKGLTKPVTLDVEVTG